MTRLTLLPDATISCLACSCCSSSEALLLICSTASPARRPAFSAKLSGFTCTHNHNSLQLTAEDVIKQHEPRAASVGLQATVLAHALKLDLEKERANIE